MALRSLVHGVFRSADEGRSWEALPALSGTTQMAAGDGHALFAVGATLLHSTDGGLTAEVLEPFEPGAAASIHPALSNEWWIGGVSSSQPPVLVRSADDGTSFASVGLPGTPATGTGLQLAGGPAVLLVLEGVLHRWDAGAWETLYTAIGTLNDPIQTGSGAVLVRDGTDLVRWFDGAVAVVGTAVVDVAVLDDGTLVRLTLDGRLQTSTDDALVWNDTLGPAPQPPGATLQSFGTGVLTGGLRWNAGETAWSVDEPGPGPLPTGPVLDVAFGGGKAAVLLVEGSGVRVYISTDDGDSWAAGHPFTTRYEALALSPDGERIFIGGPAGRYHFLDGDGQLVGESEGEARSLTTHTIHQVVWTDDDTEYLFVSAAGNRDGALLVGTPASVTLDWTSIDPYIDPMFPQRENIASFHGIRSSEGTAIVGSRLYMENIVQEELLLVNDFGWVAQTPWTSIPRAEAFGVPISMASAAFPACRDAANLYASDRLFFGNAPVELISDSLLGTLHDVQCAPDGSVWLGTSTGLFRLRSP